MERQYCPICGKRQVPFSTRTVEAPGVTYTYYLYYSDTTELICFGHPQRTPVPQAFYTALSDEEVAL